MHAESDTPADTFFDKKALKQEKRLLRKQKKEAEQKKLRRKKILQKVGKGGIVLGILLIVGGGFWQYISRIPVLPPMSAQGHTEGVPSGFVLTEPMKESVQRHMLEHAEGRGRPGVLIQYNCQDYECEEGLIEKLQSIVTSYPGYVYLAPNRYDGKIILTKAGRRQILDSFDEDAIRRFIEES